MKNIKPIIIAVSLAFNGLASAEEKEYYVPFIGDYGEEKQLDNQPFKQTSPFVKMRASNTDPDEEKKLKEPKEKAKAAPYKIPKTIIDWIKRNPNLTSLTKAIKAADLAIALSGPGAFTFFAPTNEAFEKLPPRALDTLLLPENKEALVSILTYHVISKRMTASDLKSGKLQTLQGSEISVFKDSSGVSINGAKLVKKDTTCPNGIIHEIDNLMMPEILF